ncbi:AraC family transcriptional regulator [Nocardia sp. CDC160]|uniref:AraC family transcriptional regulator n=1 Tax=Nocardia sp. CDC160 TaxID=3112166 RepID=UPI002DBF3795|nr:AraC family transcriptional regulator [Nocardia sp. CDC160]MEC3916413.1 AraC family transcriptional regulator [Nocardia sp. CDC160]
MQLLAQVAAEFGISRERLLRGSGTPIDIEPTAEITARQEFTVVRNLLRECGHVAGLGIEAGRRYHVSVRGPLTPAMLASQSLREVVGLVLPHLELTWTYSQVTFDEADGSVMMRIDGRDHPADLRPFLVERVIAAAQIQAGDLLGQPLPLTGVSFRHTAPADISRYVRVLGVVPVFGASVDAMRFDARYLDMPLPQANPLVRASFEAAGQQLLAQRRARVGIAGAVRNELSRNPGAIPDITAVAGALRMSVRTLSRRLDDEGVSFRRLVDEVRAARAEELLTVERLSTEQAARRLGYSKPSSFVRAFKRWHGVTPQAIVRRSAPRTTGWAGGATV